MDPLFTEEQLNRMSREDILSLMKAMQEQYRKQETKIRILEEKTKELEFLNAMLSDRLTLAQRRHFGPSSEKNGDGYIQLSLFNEAEQEADPDMPEPDMEDIDFEGCNLTVNKSYQHINGRDVVTPPKTPKSIHTVSIPEFLRDELKAYTEWLYGLHRHDRIFPYTKSFFEHEMVRGTRDGTVKRIRLHDIRHSHASLLIELGFSPLAVADRLGHEKVETTLNTYSHLFPHKRDEVAEKLQKLK